MEAIPAHVFAWQLSPLICAQSAAELQRQLRQQEFELYSPNPRMLPAEYHPRKLHVSIAVEPPAQQEEPKCKKKGGQAGGPKAKRGKGVSS